MNNTTENLDLDEPASAPTRSEPVVTVGADSQTQKNGQGDSAANGKAPAGHK